MSKSSDAQIFQAIIDFFNWTYEVDIPSDQKVEIVQNITSNWHSEDHSDVELVEYILKLYDFLFNLSSYKRSKARNQVQEIFKKVFSKVEMNERGRILQSVHNILEQLRPGCTRVVMPRQPSNIAPNTIPSSQQGFNTQPIQPTPVQPSQIPHSHPTQAPNPQHGVSMPSTPQIDPQQIMLDAQREAQMATLKSNLAAIKHQTTMSIINNIR